MEAGFRPAEFDFPLSWSGPDGIGASPFDEFAEDEGPDVDCSDGQEVAVALRFSASTGMFNTAKWSAMKKASKRPSSSRCFTVLRKRAASAPSTSRWS